MLTGETFQNKERIKKFMGDHAFYFGNRYSNGDKHWYAHPDKVDELVALIPDLGYIPSRHAPVSKTTYRYDCKDSQTGIEYDINNDEHWHIIHATKPGTNVKDTAKSNQNLVCPEKGCNIRFKTVMGSKERALHRKKFEDDCEKCGKISTPPEAESSDPPEHLKYVYTPGAIP
ncbi:hypothetical protein GMA12_02975 [Kocuria sediminis]|uniref:Uncharacterized protein n=1 Tax=Kocuria sediminis TaxID=1038857 RepID=A0A6N8GFW9_9MICC|nr:hypothetical protein [Kocuria sediminis]MUN62116.1 hypothetical protein [Kocuria sediminis]